MELGGGRRVEFEAESLPSIWPLLLPPLSKTEAAEPTPPHSFVGSVLSEDEMSTNAVFPFCLSHKKKKKAERKKKKLQFVSKG